jgi:predicted phosphodiesterase
MRLLHLSDIHFGGYGPVWDEDEDQREQVLEDVKRLVGNGGPIDGIIVGGDIAFSGQPHEYARARSWLDALVDVCGCRPEQVWMVPGNHDVDRAHIGQSAILRDFRRAVRACEPSDLNRILRERLADDPHGETLVSMLKAYNEFAFPWGCDVSARRFHWKDGSLRLGGRIVVLWGMNSVLLSDAEDAANQPEDGTPANLVLGRRQCQIPKVEGTVRIAIVHHPPNWLKDWHAVRPFVGRAHVVLFGHEHAYRADQDEPDGTVYVRAGAVGPEQGDDWVPSYNLLTLHEDGDRLRVVVEPRRWIASETTFGPHSDGIRTFTVALDSKVAALDNEDLVERGDSEPANATPLSAASDVSPAPDQDADSPDRRRELVFRYLSCPATRREEIARKLEVFEVGDAEMPEGEFYAAILHRIRDRGLIDQLAKELDT